MKMYLRLAYKMYHLFNYTVSCKVFHHQPNLEDSEELRIGVAGNTQLGFVQQPFSIP